MMKLGKVIHCGKLPLVTVYAMFDCLLLCLVDDFGNALPMNEQALIIAWSHHEVCFWSLDSITDAE